MTDKVTAILTVWKRNNYQQQIDRLLSQTEKPHQILIYQNESHVNVEVSPDISLIHSKDVNFKYHGRFTLPLLCDTEYTAIFDDDTMPGDKWLENCLDTSCRHNAIVGANGRVVTPEMDNSKLQGYGDGIPVEEEIPVDFVGHCWFFKTEWCRNIWKDKPFSWDNGEDIHFAASCQLYENIGCYLPRMPTGHPSLWGDSIPELGRDQHASWRRSNHEETRTNIIRHWIKKGWQPICLRH